MVNRCFKCSRFGHIKKHCKNDQLVCPVCAENHEFKDCKSQSKKCINCTNFNNRYKTNFTTDHSCQEIKKCQAYNYQLELLKSKTDYGKHQ